MPNVSTRLWTTCPPFEFELQFAMCERLGGLYFFGGTPCLMLSNTLSARECPERKCVVRQGGRRAQKKTPGRIPSIPTLEVSLFLYCVQLHLHAMHITRYRS
jgi:hypothetical protein